MIRRWLSGALVLAAIAAQDPAPTLSGLLIWLVLGTAAALLFMSTLRRFQ